jgi:hypothetical protein
VAKKRKNITRKVVRESEDKPYIPKVDVKPDIDEDGWETDSGDLTIRQRSFVEALVGPAGGNATKAAEMAGYAPENRIALQVTASRLLSNAMVQEAIAHALAKRRASPEWCKNQLIDLAQSSMKNFISIGDDGEPKLDFAKAAAMGALGQIKEFKEEGIKGGDGELTVVKRTIKIHDRISALQTLAKLHGLVSDSPPPPDKDAIKVRAVKRKPNADA